MKITTRLFAITALLTGGSALCAAQSSSPSSSGSTATTSSSTAPYTEGSVWEITMVHVKPGMGDDYLKGLAKNLKTSLEEEKKQGLIVSCKVLLGDASTPGDYNIMNMVEYKTWGHWITSGKRPIQSQRKSWATKIRYARVR